MRSNYKFSRLIDKNTCPYTLLPSHTSPSPLSRGLKRGANLFLHSSGITERKFAQGVRGFKIYRQFTVSIPPSIHPMFRDAYQSRWETDGRLLSLLSAHPSLVLPLSLDRSREEYAHRGRKLEIKLYPAERANALFSPALVRLSGRRWEIEIRFNP